MSIADYQYFHMIPNNPDQNEDKVKYTILDQEYSRIDKGFLSNGNEIIYDLVIHKGKEYFKQRTDKSVGLLYDYDLNVVGYIDNGKVILKINVKEFLNSLTKMRQ